MSTVHHLFSCGGSVARFVTGEVVIVLVLLWETPSTLRLVKAAGRVHLDLRVLLGASLVIKRNHVLLISASTSQTLQALNILHGRSSSSAHTVSIYLSVKLSIK